MAGLRDKSGDDATRRSRGRLGNSYESNPRAKRHPPLRERIALRRQARARARGADTQTLAREKAKRAAEEISTVARIDHQATHGGHNLLLFHTWGKKETRNNN